MKETPQSKALGNVLKGKNIEGKKKWKLGESKTECNICSKTTKHTHYK